MFTRPCDLSDSAVADAVTLGWGPAVDEIEYAPVGFGSHHWRVSAAGRRWFVTVDDLDERRRDVADRRDDAAARLFAALGTARALRTGGLDFVIGPEPTLTGDVGHRVNQRYLAAAYCWRPSPTTAAAGAPAPFRSGPSNCSAGTPAR